MQAVMTFATNGSQILEVFVTEACVRNVMDLERWAHSAMLADEVRQLMPSPAQGAPGAGPQIPIVILLSLAEGRGEGGREIRGLLRQHRDVLQPGQIFGEGLGTASRELERNALCYG